MTAHRCSAWRDSSRHTARAAPLTAGVPVLRQLPRVLEAASGALAETAVRVALVEMDGFFEPYDAAHFRTACGAAVPGSELDDVNRAPLRSGIAEQTHAARIGETPVRTRYCVRTRAASLPTISRSRQRASPSDGR